MMMLRVIVGSAAVGSGTANAQEALQFRVTPPVSTPAQPSVEVWIWAAFNPDDYAFATSSFALEASDGEFWAAGCLVSCGFEGAAADGRFLRARPRQFNPGADTSNPIATAIGAWRPGSLQTRDVLLSSMTSTFSVFPDPESTVGASRMSTFTEGSAIIRVRRCYADCDGTDGLDFFDFLCFQDAFATGDFYADCDGSGELDFFDFLCFQNEFAMGCG